MSCRKNSPSTIGIFVAVAAIFVAALPLFAAGTPTSSLFMPQGSDAGSNNGDYLSTPSAANLPYKYWIEVPAGASRLVVDLFDADWGAGGTGEAASQRDRDRGGTTFGGVSTYQLFNPAGVLVRSSDSDAFAVGGNNAWATLYDSNSPPPFVSGFATNSTTGATSLSVTVPAGGAGDLLIAAISTLGLADASLSGWTLIDEANCSSNCRLEVYYKTSNASEPPANFTIASSQAAAGAVYRVSGASLALPTQSSQNGNDATPIAPSLAGTGSRLILRLATKSDNDFTAGPSGHVTDFLQNVNPPGFGTDLGFGGANQPISGNALDAAFTTSSTDPWRAMTIGIAPSGSAPALMAGHWELRVDDTSSGGNDINAVGMRAHDGNSGPGGTEYPMYIDSHTQIGANTEAGANTARAYDIYPYITSGCTAQESDFDFDRNNGTGGGPAGIFGRFVLNSRTGIFTQTISGTISTDDNWASTQINRWTTDQLSTDNGIWPSTVEIWPYSGGNSNYANYYFRNVPTSAAPPPGANPTANSFRVYLPTDAGGTPVKPYLEQLLTYQLGGGPNPPTVGTASWYRVTVRMVNPTAQAITFSASNLVTANIPGGNARYGGSPVVSQGTIVSQPTVNQAAAADITWNPGTLAAGGTAILSYIVRVTPPSAGARVVATGTPALNGTRAQYLDETGNASQARATYLFGPICELAVTQNVSTRALVTDFAVEQSRGQVAVSWSTTTEDGTAGYELFRWDAAADDWVRVTERMIPATPGETQGARYRVLDPGADARAELTYALREVEMWGSANEVGRWTLKPAVASGDFRRDAMVTREPLPRAMPFGTTLVTDTELATERATPAPTNSGAIVVGTRERGLYRLPASLLAARFGTSLATVNDRIRNGNVRIRNFGADVRWLRDTSGGQEAVVFFAEKLDSLYSRENPYRVSLEPGLAMETGAVAPARSSAPSYVFERKNVEQDDRAGIVVATDPEADYWFWTYLAGDDAVGGVRELPFTADRPVGSDADEITVRLQGASERGVENEHEVELFLNDVPLGGTSFTGFDVHDVTVAVPPGTLVDGANVLRLEAHRGNGVDESYVLVDGFDVDFLREARAEGAKLDVPQIVGRAFNGAGFPDTPLALLDLSEPRSPRLLTGASEVPAGDGTRSLRFLRPGTMPLWIQSLASAATPESIRAESLAGLRQSKGAEYVIVAAPGLESAAQTLADDRAAEGLSTKVVGLTSIYDEFADGLPTPHAIRAFAAWAFDNWSVAPRYLLLAGAGTFDYRGIGGTGDGSLPALMTTSFYGLFASDSGYGDVDGDGVPEIAVGRLPALSSADLTSQIEKIRTYETASGGWVDRLVLASDTPDHAMDFPAESAALAASLVRPFDVVAVTLDPANPSAAHDDLVAAIQAGAGFFNYIGHGGLDRMTTAGTLLTTDVGALANGGRAPFTVALTCAVNRFELPGFPSLGEELVRRADGGSVAVYAPAGLGMHGDAREFADRVAAAVYESDIPRAGDAILSAERLYADAGGSLDLLRLYTLLGDPALRLRRPVTGSANPGPGSTGE